MKPSRSYREELSRGLQRPKEAARYLNAALEDGDRKVFLLALRDVAAACGGMTKLARHAKLNRENLYRMLSKNGNPGLSGLGGLLDAMGLRLAIEVK
jgi:probable addiction module antidote protein